MNPEAEKLRHAMSVVEIKWLQDNADTLAELVDAAMDAASSVPPRGVGVIDPAPLHRLARAVVDFKGPQEPPEPDHDHVDVLRCPHHACMWWVAKDRGSLAKYQDHYREQHSEREPQSWGKTAERLSGEHHGRGQEWA